MHIDGQLEPRLLALTLLPLPLLSLPNLFDDERR